MGALMTLIRVFIVSLLSVIAISAQAAGVLKCQLMISDSNSQEIESSTNSANIISNGTGDLKMNYGLVDIHAIQNQATISLQVIDQVRKVDFTTTGENNAFATYQLTPDHILNVGCASAAQ